MLTLGSITTKIQLPVMVLLLSGWGRPEVPPDFHKQITRFSQIKNSMLQMSKLYQGASFMVFFGAQRETLCQKGVEEERRDTRFFWVPMIISISGWFATQRDDAVELERPDSQGVLIFIYVVTRHLPRGLSLLAKQRDWRVTRMTSSIWILVTITVCLKGWAQTPHTLWRHSCNRMQHISNVNAT